MRKQFADLGDNFDCVPPLHEKALLAIANKAAKVGARKDYRFAGGEELRQLAREAVVIELAGPARLHQDVGDREERGHLRTRQKLKVNEPAGLLRPLEMIL